MRRSVLAIAIALGIGTATAGAAVAGMLEGSHAGGTRILPVAARESMQASTPATSTTSPPAPVPTTVPTAQPAPAPSTAAASPPSPPPSPSQATATTSLPADAGSGTTGGTGTAAPPMCSTSQLSVAHVRSDAAMGHADEVFSFLNGGSTCRMRGYPAVQMLSTSGAALSTTQSDGVSGYTATPAAFPTGTVVLAAGGRAYFVIWYSDGTGEVTGGSCPTSASLAVTPPEQQDAVVFAWALTPYGGGPTGVHCGEITVSPLEPTTGV